MSFDPDTVAAFVDGELDDLTMRRIEREAAIDPALAAEIARHRALKARLAAHYAPIAQEAVPERLRSLLVDDKVDTSLADRRSARGLLSRSAGGGRALARLGPRPAARLRERPLPASAARDPLRATFAAADATMDPLAGDGEDA